MTKIAIIFFSLICLHVHSQSVQKTTLISNITAIFAGPQSVKSQLGHILTEGEKITYLGKKPLVLEGH